MKLKNLIGGGDKHIPINILIRFIDNYILNERYQKIWQNKQMRVIKRYFKNYFMDYITTLDILYMSNEEFLIYQSFIN